MNVKGCITVITNREAEGFPLTTLSLRPTCPHLATISCLFFFNCQYVQIYPRAESCNCQHDQIKSLLQTTGGMLANFRRRDVCYDIPSLCIHTALISEALLKQANSPHSPRASSANGVYWRIGNLVFPWYQQTEVLRWQVQAYHTEESPECLKVQA